MTIFQEMLDLDRELELYPYDDIAYVNDFPNSTESERKEIYNRLTTQYMQGDKISMLPQCQKGCFRSAKMVGLICPHCGTVVKSDIEKDIRSVVWFRNPLRHPEARLMSPIFYTMLSKRFTKQGWDVILYLTDQSYNPPVKDTQFMARVREAGFERGWIAFCQQFDAIMNFLFSLKDFQVDKGEVDYLYYLYVKERKKIFCQQIPLPNRSLFVFENTNTGIYRNDATGKAMSFISIMLSIEKSIQPLSDRAKENRVAKLYNKIAEYLKDYIRTELSPKPGQIRRHTIATKNIMAFRSVITSITDPWDYNAISVPWFVGLTMFRPMLLNKLVKKGFSHNKALDLLLSHTGHFHPLLYTLLYELKEEAQDGKIWTTMQRNPSLKQGSLQLVYIGEFKKDPGDRTTGMPLPIVKAPNAKIVGLLYRDVESTLV